MRNLLDFLSKYSFFFLFLVLEVICFILIYNNNYFQRSRTISTTSGLTGNANAAFHDIASYIHLKRANEQLTAENAFLRTQLKQQSMSATDSSDAPADDTILYYIPAQVISMTVQKRNNRFMVDKGSLDGVRKDMGVITSSGIVGIITDVSKHYSSGISILHKDSKISGRIKKNRHLVNVSWGGINYRLGKLEDIPTHVDLQEGDTIVTSGNSHIFPEGLLIGTVEEVHGSDQLFKTADLRFTADYNQLYHSYIIDNLRWEELKTLSQEN